MNLAALALVALQSGLPAAAAPAPLPDDARALRDFALFAHRRIADDVIAGRGPYLDTLLARFPACQERSTTIAQLKQALLGTAETDAFAARVVELIQQDTPLCPQGEPPAPPPQQQQQQQQQQHPHPDDTATQAQWHALLHYRARRDGGWRSQADSPAFFLSANGKTSPSDELAANLAALHGAASGAYACRFPARYEWLRLRDKLAAAMPDATTACPELANWYAQFAARRVSINFASSYLENPSSTFGHTFLRFTQGPGPDLLSPTLNFAASTAARDGDLAFIRKGLFGGFPGVADALPFYRRLRSYTETEGRDIWEFALALTPAETRRLVLHTWEVKDGVFDYFFVDENCAYRTLALVDVARPDLNLLDGYTASTVPVDTIRTLRQSGLLGAQTVWPAFPKRVRAHEAQLGPARAQLARALAGGHAQGADLASFAPQQQAAVLQLAFEYASLQIDRDSSARASRKQVLYDIVRARLALATASPLAMPAGGVSPQDGHLGSPWSAAAYRQAGQSGLSLGWAGFQHRLTDRLAGYEPYAEITVLQPEVRLGADGHVRLARIDWLEAQSTIPASTLFAPRAWRLLVSSREQPYAQGEHMASSLSYQSGAAWAYGQTVLAVLPGLSLEGGDALQHKVGAAGVLSLLVNRQGTDWAAQFGWEGEKFLAGASLYRSTLHFQGALFVARDMALTLGASRTIAPYRDNTVSAGIRMFFRPL